MAELHMRCVPYGLWLQASQIVVICTLQAVVFLSLTSCSLTGCRKGDSYNDQGALRSQQLRCPGSAFAADLQELQGLLPEGSRISFLLPSDMQLPET